MKCTNEGWITRDEFLGGVLGADVRIKEREDQFR